MEDSEVPEEYWLHDEPYMLAGNSPQPLQIHKIAQTVDGMGHPSKPNAVQTFDGIFPTQTTQCHNGGVVEFLKTGNGVIQLEAHD